MVNEENRTEHFSASTDSRGFLKMLEYSLFPCRYCTARRARRSPRIASLKNLTVIPYTISILHVPRLSCIWHGLQGYRPTPFVLALIASLRGNLARSHAQHSCRIIPIRPNIRLTFEIGTSKLGINKDLQCSA